MSSYLKQQPRFSAASIGAQAPVGMLTLLGVQFLVGMAVNLYVQLPPGGLSTAMTGNAPSPLLMVHMMLGMVLAAGGLATLALSFPYGRGPIIWAAAGLGGIVLAAIAGMVFAMGSQSNAASYLMAVGFLVSTGSYVTELLAIRGKSILR